MNVLNKHPRTSLNKNRKSKTFPSKMLVTDSIRDESNGPNSLQPIVRNTVMASDLIVEDLTHVVDKNTHFSDPVLKVLNIDRFDEMYDIVKSPMDGHCFIHSLIYSVNRSGNKFISYMDLIKIIRNETTRNMGTYMNYLVEYTHNQVLNEMENYLKSKIYNSNYVDLIPFITANALGIIIDIYEKKLNRKITLTSIKPESDNTNLITVPIFKSGDHYDSLRHKSRLDESILRTNDTTNRPDTLMNNSCINVDERSYPDVSDISVSTFANLNIKGIEMSKTVKHSKINEDTLLKIYTWNIHGITQDKLDILKRNLVNFL